MATPADSTVTVSQKVLQDMLDKAMARGGAGASPAAQPKTFAKNGVGRGSRADIQKKYSAKYAKYQWAEWHDRVVNSGK